MAKYSVRIEMQHKKQGTLEFVETYLEHDKAAHAFGVWQALVGLRDSVVQAAFLIKHESETTIGTAVKGIKQAASQGAANVNG